MLKVRQFVTLDFSYLLFLNELQNKHFLSLLKSYFFEGFIVTKRMLSNPRRRKKYGAKQLSKHKRKHNCLCKSFRHFLFNNKLPLLPDHEPKVSKRFYDLKKKTKKKHSAFSNCRLSVFMLLEQIYSFWGIESPPRFCKESSFVYAGLIRHEHFVNQNLSNWITPFWFL